MYLIITMHYSYMNKYSISCSLCLCISLYKWNVKWNAFYMYAQSSKHHIDALIIAEGFPLVLNLHQRKRREHAIVPTGTGEGPPL